MQMPSVNSAVTGSDGQATIPWYQFFSTLSKVPAFDTSLQSTLLGLGNYINDAAASAGGVLIGGMYRNGSILMVRVS